jgi:hypothetical protein
MHVRQRKPNSRSCPDESYSNSAVIVVSAATKLHTGTMTMTFSKEILLAVGGFGLPGFLGA